MADTADFDGVVAMLKGMTAKLGANIDLLTKLDSATGDGDHGVAIQRVVNAIDSTIGKDSAGQIKGLLNDVGWAVMAVPGGSTGPLFGSLIVGMSEGAPEDAASLDCSGVATVLETGQAKLRKQTKAVEGVDQCSGVHVACASKYPVGDYRTGAAAALLELCCPARKLKCECYRAYLGHMFAKNGHAIL